MANFVSRIHDQELETENCGPSLRYRQTNQDKKCVQKNVKKKNEKHCVLTKLKQYTLIFERNKEMIKSHKFWTSY